MVAEAMEKYPKELVVIFAGNNKAVSKLLGGTATLKYVREREEGREYEKNF
jgi:hypothetical protein